MSAAWWSSLSLAGLFERGRAAPGAAEAGDRALLLRARDGDALACRELLGRHAERLHAIVRRAHPDLLLADDVVQEAFIRALAEADHLREDASAFAWLVRIALNLATDQRRRTHRERLVAAPGEACGVDARGVEDRSPESCLLEAEDVRRVHAALDRLDAHTRELVVLRYFGGLSTLELGEVFEKSEVAIRKELQRARARLRGLLDGEDGG